MMQTARPFQVVVEHAHALQALRLAHAIENPVDDLAEVVAVLARAGRSLEGQRTLPGLGRLQHLDGALIAAAAFQIFDRRRGFQHLMGARTALRPLDSGRHGTLDHQGVGNRVAKRTAQIDIQGVQILTHRGLGDEAIPGQGAGEVVTGHVLLRMAGDGDVIVVDQHFDVQLFADGEAGRFGIIAFHLTAVGAEQNHGFAGICQGHAVDEGPQVAETAGAEFDAGSQHFFGVAGKSAVVFAIMQQLFGGHGAVQARSTGIVWRPGGRLHRKKSARWARRSR